MNDKIIMDTNVAVKAATPQQDCKEEEWEMRKMCVDFIRNLVKNPNSKLVKGNAAMQQSMLEII